ncbi:Predicted arabinose efflux permease, MFS family [Micromonospora echinaurantiaca]|uniref:Predicted arabinose efflux permease, MFS family n=1 Tax=Micromonospora echinaurantiaca TaxID=47857 RepID=A0A1C5H8C3_9ACTN|nr:MFS transporter [Micromonospora echinaurantiaca]SCG42286.1 Predicted arabinose efflux permease, MFS family [Micromonospora echinaurantiaca]
MGATFAALRHRNYRIWAAAGFVSVVGTWMQVLGVNWYVLAETRSATSMGLAVLLQALPTLLLSVWGGALADRLRAKPLLIAAQAAHAALAAGLAVVALTGAGGLPAIYAISLATGAVSAIEGPVMGRWTSTLVDRESLGNALALGSLTHSAGRILGMSAGAVVVAAVGPALLFAINAASFVAVLAALFAVRERELHTGGPAADAEPADGGIRAGFRYLLRQPVVLVALALSFVLGSLGRNYQVTMAAMSEGPLGAGAAGYGVLSTVFAVGTVLGAFVAARRRHLGYGVLVGAGLLASGLQVGAGLAPNTLGFAAVILPIAAAAVIIDTTVGTRAQLDTDYAMRGRVLAALAVTGSVSAAVGAPLLGWLSEHAGPRQTLVLAGVATAVATAVAGVALDGLRGRRLRGRITRALAAPRVRRAASTAARVVRPAATVARPAPMATVRPVAGVPTARWAPPRPRGARLRPPADEYAAAAPRRARRRPGLAAASRPAGPPVDCARSTPETA